MASHYRILKKKIKIQKKYIFNFDSRFFSRLLWSRNSPTQISRYTSQFVTLGRKLQINNNLIGLTCSCRHIFFKQRHGEGQCPPCHPTASKLRPCRLLQGRRLHEDVGVRGAGSRTGGEGAGGVAPGGGQVDDRSRHVVTEGRQFGGCCGQQELKSKFV